jgi:hypothetical protein
MGPRTRPLAVVAAAALSLAGSRAPAADARPAPPLPREASRWVGEPVSWDSLRGRVALVFVWTFG